MQAHACTHTYTHAWAYLLYNKHWSKTGPSCQVTAVTTNNDYPLRAPQLLLHNHQRRGDPPLLGEQCTHEWASSSLTPTPISPLRARQTARLSICTCLWTSANLGTSVRLSFFSEHHWLHICSALLCQIITCIFCDTKYLGYFVFCKDDLHIFAQTRLPKRFPTFPADTLTNLNQLLVSHQHHLVGLGSH